MSGGESQDGKGEGKQEEEGGAHGEVVAGFLERRGYGRVERGWWNFAFAAGNVMCCKPLVVFGRRDGAGVRRMMWGAGGLLDTYIRLGFGFGFEFGLQQ